MIKYDSSSEVFCHDYRNLVWVINELMKNYWWLVITVPVIFIDNNKRKLLQFLPACQNNKARCQTFLKLTIKALELSQYYYSVVFFWIWTCLIPCFSTSIVNFKPAMRPEIIQKFCFSFRKNMCALWSRCRTQSFLPVIEFSFLLC